MSVDFTPNPLIKYVALTTLILLFTYRLPAQGCPSFITLSSQSDVDNFSQNYPGCTDLTYTELTIEGGTVVDLSPLSFITVLSALSITQTEVTDLTGLDNLIVVDNRLEIIYNFGLISLTGLEGLRAPANSTTISSNFSLNDISQLNGVDFTQAFATPALTVTNNQDLSTCNITTICNGIVDNQSKFRFSSNGTGCQSTSEVVATCTPVTCDDGIQNGDETGVDCGGSSCDACPTCDDGVQNGAETGVDCGGPDCGGCATCDDGIQNGGETGVDCGGADCTACPTCDDGVQNGSETGVDCGGPDCDACPTCNDGIRNGSETGVDCGGPDCGACDLDCPNPSVITQNIWIQSQTQIDGFRARYGDCVHLTGNLRISEFAGAPPITNLAGLSAIVQVDGQVNIQDNPSLSSLDGLEGIRGSIPGLRIIDNEVLTSIDALANISVVRGALLIQENDLLENLDGLQGIERVLNLITISRNPQLLELSGLSNLRFAGTYLNIQSNQSLQDASFLNNLSVDSIGTLQAPTVSVIGMAHNPNLTACAIDFFCRLDAAGKTYFVNNNGPDCSAGPGVLLCRQSCLPNGLPIRSQQDVVNFANNYPNCKEVGGNHPYALTISGNVTDLTPLQNLKALRGRLQITGTNQLQSLYGLHNIEYMDGYTPPFIPSPFPEGDGEILIAGNTALVSIDAFGKLRGINTHVEMFNNPQLSSLDGMQGLDSLRFLNLRNNANLTSLSGLETLRHVELSAFLSNLPRLKDMAGLDNLSFLNGMSLWRLDSLTSLAGLENLETLNNCSIEHCNSLTNLDGLTSLTTMRFKLELRSNANLMSVSGLRNVTGDVRDVTLLPHPDYTGLSEFLDGVTISRSVNLLSGNTDEVNLRLAPGISGSVGVSCSDLVSSLDISIVDVTARNSLLEELNGGLRIKGGADNFSITGLDQLTTVRGNLFLTELGGRSSINFLPELTEVESLTLTSNPDLLDISFINALDIDTLEAVTIGNNPHVATCANNYLCEYLATEKPLTLYNNGSPVCNDTDDLLEACGIVSAHYRFNDRVESGIARDQNERHHATRFLGTYFRGNVGINDGAVEFVRYYDGIDGGLLDDGRFEIPSLDISGEALSVSTYINPVPTTTEACIVGKSNNTLDAQAQYWSIGHSQDNELIFRVKLNGTTQELRSQPDLVAGYQWQHVAATYDGTHMRLYHNGLEVESMVISGTIDAAPDVPVTIGNWSNADRSINRYFLGLMDELKIANRVFTAQDIVVEAGGVLPVEWAGFVAEKVKDEVQLQWWTTAETDNQQFRVEHTTDQRNWQVIAEVSPQAGTAPERSYSAVHPQPLPGVNYYRIQQVDFDGAITYSPIRSVAFVQEGSFISPYPNPTDDVLWLNRQDESGGALQVVNIYGKVVQVIEPHVKRLSLGHLPAGVYLITKMDEHGPVARILVR